MTHAMTCLEDVLAADAFPAVDLALRRGRHIDRDDMAWYALLVDGQAHLEAFYRRYGCELVHKPDGYFYLLPMNDKLGRRHLSAGEMLVGQALTLLYLDPAAVEGSGTVTREQVLSQLAGVLGPSGVLEALNPKRKRHDERAAEETARSKVAEALRRLESLGFVESVDESHVRLRASLMRFADPVRGAEAPEAALEQLVAEGELELSESASDADVDAGVDGDVPDASPDEPPEGPR